MDAPLEQRVARACARDGRSEDEIRARIARQHSSADDPRVTCIVKNYGTAEQLQAESEALYHKLMTKYAMI